MNVSVVNLGCKVNRVESDTIAAAYLQNGAELTEARDADIIVVNTCTVTEEAEKKTRKTIRKLLRENAHASLLVTGCAATINPDFYTCLDERIELVDKHEFLSTELHGIEQLAQHPLVRVGSYFPTRVGVKVQDGCNHSCTYCIVHVARGKAWSRPFHLIAKEVCQLAEQGVKELVLSGIDLGSYNFTDEVSDKRYNLSELILGLLDLLDSKGFSDTRLRISSIEPRSIKKDFVQVLARCEGRVCRHLHLPLQSGSSRVLAEMNRPYTAPDFLSLVAYLKESVGDLSLTTDIIVGFPGETDQDFDQTYQLTQEVGFSKIHVFRYSKRAGTPAALRDDQIPAKVKEVRAHALLQLSDELRYRYALRNKDRKERIVVEQRGWGMSESYYKIHLDDSCRPGSVIESCLAQSVELEGDLSWMKQSK